MRPPADPTHTERRLTRTGIFALVALLHVLAVLGLIRAFAPDFAEQVVERAVAGFTVTVTTPEPEPTPEPTPSAVAPEPAGAAGRKAIPKEVSAPVPRIPLSRTPAPVAASTGSANTAGAARQGTGPGAGGEGSGTGGGGGAKAVKIAGDINSARDYPRDSRDLRIDDYVVVAITVGMDGAPTACRVHRPSRDAQANEITCKLAMQRFRFRPATDAAGNPVVSTYGWRQRWHY